MIVYVKNPQVTKLRVARSHLYVRLYTAHNINQKVNSDHVWVEITGDQHSIFA